MQKIIPHLWFDKEAGEAAEFYASVFDDSRIDSNTTLRDTPSGDAEIVALACPDPRKGCSLIAPNPALGAVKNHHGVQVMIKEQQHDPQIVI
jgi:predicted 3-demethylubiquinone-9 3-methyltransferase (glyoxalase superfamily)